MRIGVVIVDILADVAVQLAAGTHGFAAEQHEIDVHIVFHQEITDGVGGDMQRRHRRNTI